jgi:hypothetical protein
LKKAKKMKHSGIRERAGRNRRETWDQEGGRVMWLDEVDKTKAIMG